jgi:hypothetical protein
LENVHVFQSDVSSFDEFEAFVSSGPPDHQHPRFAPYATKSLVALGTHASSQGGHRRDDGAAGRVGDYAPTPTPRAILAWRSVGPEEAIATAHE